MDGIFDSHAHYDDRAFAPDRAQLFADGLRQGGVTGVISCGSSLKSSQQNIALAKQYDFFYAAAGIHPHDAGRAPAEWEERLKSLLREAKVVAVGEIGLDYHYDFSPRNVQKDVFIRQLDLARSLGLPAIIHDREAHGDIMTLLREKKPQGVVHCFSGSVELMEETVRLGLYIGLGGAVTFRNARVSAEVAAAVPLDRLLLETDCPYMTPVPFRGERNDSRHIALVAEKIAQLRGMDAQELIDICRANTCRLFGIKEMVQ